ncbi:hypothetical protein Avbf_15414 [Armadillidium vulgare]|nr:hypothetical protein Avbf_15414 [Armadillidium vulgare]
MKTICLYIGIRFPRGCSPPRTSCRRSSWGSPSCSTSCTSCTRPCCRCPRCPWSSPSKNFLNIS